MADLMDQDEGAVERPGRSVYNDSFEYNRSRSECRLCVLLYSLISSIGEVYAK